MVKVSTLLLSLLTQLGNEKQKWKQLPDTVLDPDFYAQEISFNIYTKNIISFALEEKNLYKSEHKFNFQLTSLEWILDHRTQQNFPQAPLPMAHPKPSRKERDPKASSAFSSSSCCKSVSHLETIIILGGKGDKSNSGSHHPNCFSKYIFLQILEIVHWNLFTF